MGADDGHKPKILGLLCNWCCYGGADLAGVSRFQYPPYLRVVRVMCSGRVDPAHILRALARGLDGVFIGGCHLGDCHYITGGNYDALRMVCLLKRVLEMIGVDPRRLRIEWVSAGEGIRFAAVMQEMCSEIERLGPMGRREGEDPEELKRRIEETSLLVPYLRLLLAEKFAFPYKSEEELERIFDGKEVRRLIDDLVGGKLALMRIMGHLRGGPRSAAEIVSALKSDHLAVSGYLAVALRTGLVRFDGRDKRYALVSR